MRRVLTGCWSPLLAGPGMTAARTREALAFLCPTLQIQHHLTLLQFLEPRSQTVKLSQTRAPQFLLRQQFLEYKS